MQNQHHEHAFPKHSQSVKFNMPMPQLINSRSTNATIGNMRKLGSINDGFGSSNITSMRFADQQPNTDNYFQHQQMQQAHNQVPMINIQHPMGQHHLRHVNNQPTMNFESRSDQKPMFKKSSFKQHTLVIDET